MKVLVMSFNGDTKLETPEFDDVQKAWDYSSDLGSKWYFYPFHFVVTNSGKTIKSYPLLFAMFDNMRIKTVSKIFKTFSELPECKNMDCEEFAHYVYANVKF
jgi:CO dehydrogenase/acetyl-CoA synthase delta subunit